MLTVSLCTAIITTMISEARQVTGQEPTPLPIVSVEITCALSAAASDLALYQQGRLQLR